MQYPLKSITYPNQQVSHAYHNDMGYQQATHHGQQKYGGPFQTEFDEPMNMDFSCRPGRWMQHSTSRPHYNEPRPKLPVYDGRSEWQSFIVPFNLLAERYDWGKRRQCEEIMLCLTNEAQIFASKLPCEIRNDLESLCAEMEKRFGDHTLPETYRRNLRSLRKSSTESYQKYAARVAESVRKAFPGINGELYNQLCVEHMINGISDQGVAYDVLSKRPKSLDEAINLLTWHHSCKSSLRPTKSDDESYTNSDDENDGHEVRRVNQKRFVTEERLQQFGRELRSSITKDVTQSVMESVKSIIVETNRKVIKE